MSTIFLVSNKVENARQHYFETKKRFMFYSAHLSNFYKQLRHQIHDSNKGTCCFYQNFLHLILRNMISKKEYTLQIN